MANVHLMRFSVFVFVFAFVCGRRSEGWHRVRHQDCCPAERFEKHAPSGQSQNTYVTSPCTITNSPCKFS